MLDATDGVTVGAAVAFYRVHNQRVEPQKVSIGACDGTTPRVTVSTRNGERTGRRATVARSRIKSNHSINCKIVLNLKSFKERYT
ncbi:MAG: hypothetical protein LBU44_02350 [Mediterranea sp.]|nr:hypothetical protein [Mediterranea sp.]